MTTAILHEPAHRSGTTWPGFHLVMRDDDTPVDLTGASIRLAMIDACGAVVFLWVWADPENPLEPNTGIEVTDPTTGELYVTGPGVLSAPSGTLRWDLKIRLASGETRVDLEGALPVVAGITQ